ncbi:SRPBCC family protein [Kribbella sp. NPDC004875]|uniref:SRPBCC family protein n=1 Tax=Kribbella sp. NPDC004875 TaxID=3364107 RepID=UPI0036746C22
MGDHEAWTRIDVAPNVVFDRLADLDHLPDYLPWMTAMRRTRPRPVEAQGLELRLPHQPVHEEVDVSTEGIGHEAGWIDVIDEDRVLRWGAEGAHEYAGELTVDFVADNESKLTVRVRTKHDEAVDAELSEALAGIRSLLEHSPSSESDSGA